MPLADGIAFETPENIQVSYRAAGLGTRFVAWFLDQILLTVVLFVVFFALLFAGIATDSIFRQIPLDPNKDPQHMLRGMAYAMGLFFLLSGFANFVYYFASEFFLSGQTWGKRRIGIRVVKANGFSLDTTSVFVRNIFRVIDHLPPMWLVPLVTARSQRLGDLVAGTIVVVDKIEKITSVREVLAGRTALEGRFRFDAATLKLARPEDLQAVEKLLDRWASLTDGQQSTFLNQIVEPLARRLKVEPPPAQDRLTFLEDFLAAAYRRQHQALG